MTPSMLPQSSQTVRTSNANPIAPQAADNSLFYLWFQSQCGPLAGLPPVASLSIASFAGTVNVQDVPFFGFVITQKRWLATPEFALPIGTAAPAAARLRAAKETVFASAIAPATASREVR